MDVRAAVTDRIGPMNGGRLRLLTGLLLFAFSASHLVSHAFGVFLVEAMEAATAVLLAPWRTAPGQALLYGALAVHLGLGLRALLARRHLRMPVGERLQLALGVSIAPLLLVHVVDARVAEWLYGIDDSYERLGIRYWVQQPLLGVGQLVLLCAVWAHGCVGIHMWLRFRPWYGRAAPPLLATAVLLPTIAVLGLANAGWDLESRSEANPGYVGDAMSRAGRTRPRPRPWPGSRRVWPDPMPGWWPWCSWVVAPETGTPGGSGPCA